MTARPRGRRARLDAVGVTNTAATVGSWFRLRIELGKPSRVESVWIYIYERESDGGYGYAKRRGRDERNWSARDEGYSNDEPILQHLRSLLLHLCGLLSHSFVSGRRLAWDKGSGHGDDSNRIWLSAIFIRPPPSPPSRESPRAPSSSCGESCSWEFSPAPDGRMRTRSERERVTRFNLHIQGVEFLVRVETSNISHSRIEVSDAFLRAIIVSGMPHNKYSQVFIRFNNISRELRIFYQALFRKIRELE